MSQDHDQTLKSVAKAGVRTSGCLKIEEIESSERKVTIQAQQNIHVRQKWAKTFQKYRKERAFKISEKHHVTVTSQPPADKAKISITVNENQTIVPFIVGNSGVEKVYLNFQATEFVKNIFTVRDFDGNVIRSIKNYCIIPGEVFYLNIYFISDQAGFYEQLLVFTFEKAYSDKFEIMCLLEITHRTSCAETNPPEGTNLLHNLQTVKRATAHGLSQVLLKNVVPLKKYKVPDSVKDSEETDKLLQRKPLKWDNYSWRFHLLLHLEEHQVTTEVEKFNQEDVLVVTHKTEKDILIVKLSDIPYSYPLVLSGCQVLVTSLNRSEQKETYKGWVQDIDEDQVYIKFEEMFPKYFNKAVRCIVKFIYNRIPLQMQHRAVALVKKHKLEEFLFPTEKHCFRQKCHTKSVPKISVLDNPEQNKAIQHIVACSAKPAPYLIFGPPGTGKTVTLVQAMKQILKIHVCHILVCAPSNSATDHLCEKILEGKVGTDKVYRLYPLSFPVANIPQSIQMNCNLNQITNALEIPPKVKLMSYKILVTTLQTVGRLVTGGIPHGHYSYIFVDEAGQATESECLIPISGLLKIQKCQVVLAGDPKQLGPIVTSMVAEKHGLGVSMLERLMRDISLYKPHKIKGFNSRFVSKLRINYRSHPAILKIPNQLFYDGDLRPCAHLEKCLYETWECLHRKDFPVIFHCVAGTKERDTSSPSLYNMAEVDVLKEYLKSLIKHLHKQGVDSVEPQEIGIIAPYRKQVEKIQRALQTDRDLIKENLENILVGTVEAFQGKEFNVILVSTVRSNPKLTEPNQNITLGFLSHAKRFNVAMTRARSLLIVVGDPRLLETDSMWNKFVHYCLKERSYRGIKLPDAEDDTLTKALLPSPW
ncbi:putative helicase mov-10-B.1 [Kryptolebias marmoratus]|uniref:putative helicase mov-10-B.1 n=1 Tax=Kryptolebias marmoratus TaxID=37003 RepID=UPI0007F8BC22|nr:putative helicase mov-10-B.1 [Kryptolebias marmoratus]